MTDLHILKDVSLRPYVTLKTGGSADMFCIARTPSQLADAFRYGVNLGLPVTVIGSGSNILPCDRGVEGLVIVNCSSAISVFADGTIEAETGCLLQELFLKSAQAGLSGLEFAVGIPGTLGGALASNAGAYRSSISEHIVELVVCDGGEPKRVNPDWMGFTYRHSKLREPDHQPFIVMSVKFQFPRGDIRHIYKMAKEFQSQRISKQPPPASAGSFFKNVNSHALAESLPSLPIKMKEAGVVPAGFLLEACGLKGYRHYGAQFSSKHANFILNTGCASASEIRQLAAIAKVRVRERFGVDIEEEVLYIGRWQPGDSEDARD